MDKLLFIDRDGTLLQEPEDQQVDSLEKVAFLKDSLFFLRKIVDETDFIAVLVSNQDGMGTAAFPEEDFLPPHRFMIECLESQGIRFRSEHIDTHFESDNHPNRKPGIGMLKEYLRGDFDIPGSFVIGDRDTDVILASNLGCKAIKISDITSSDAALTTSQWREVYQFLTALPRNITVKKKTAETQVEITLNLDGKGIFDCDTGIGFLDHMMEQLAKHANMNLQLKARGDLHVDAHHTVEDTGICLGMALSRALGKRKGIQRYGFVLPMDEAEARVSLDLGGRPHLSWDAQLGNDPVGGIPPDLFSHLFRSFCDHAKCALHIHAQGENGHHMVESIFKGFAKCIAMAGSRNLRDPGSLPTTKGVL